MFFGGAPHNQGRNGAHFRTYETPYIAILTTLEVQGKDKEMVKDNSNKKVASTLL